jgi:hypothetical protein
MRYVFIIALLLPMTSFACMQLKGDLTINGEPLTIDQKVDHDQTYSFQKGAYIVHVLLPSGQQTGTHLIDIKVDQKKDQKLATVSRGRILTKDGVEAEMVNEDSKTKETFTYKIIVKNI